jgi:hypothetical protein
MLKPSARCDLLYQDFSAWASLIHRVGFSCAFARVLPGASKSGPYGCAYAPKRN